MSWLSELGKRLAPSSLLMAGLASCSGSRPKLLKMPFGETLPVPSDAKQPPPLPLTKMMWKILPFLAAGYGLCLVDRINMGMAQLQMGAELGMTQTSFGAASSAFFLTYTALQIPASYLSAQFGVIRSLALYAICWGVVASAHGLVTTSTQLTVLRLLLGVCESGYYPGCIYVLTCWFPDVASAQAVAMFLFGASICTSAFGASSGFIMDSFNGLGGLSGWRWLFIIQERTPFAAVTTSIERLYLY